MTTVLGIDVPAALLELWSGWLAPDPQPFLVERHEDWPENEALPGSVTPETRSTYQLYGAAARAEMIWLSEETFFSLSPARRAGLVRSQVRLGRAAVPTVRGWSDLLDASVLRGQADGHRFVWWPSLLALDPAAILSRAVFERRLASRHEEVADSTWQACLPTLPRARELAGTWPEGARDCCFSTVMDAAGADSREACDSLDPIVEWLDRACRKGGDPTAAGTVLVWRDLESGLPVHAAVTIGDGWVLEKPSTDWHAPRAVVALADVVRTNRLVGQRVERRVVQQPRA